MNELAASLSNRAGAVTEAVPSTAGVAPTSDPTIDPLGPLHDDGMGFEKSWLDPADSTCGASSLPKTVAVYSSSIRRYVNTPYQLSPSLSSSLYIEQPSCPCSADVSSERTLERRVELHEIAIEKCTPRPRVVIAAQYPSASNNCDCAPSTHSTPKYSS